MASIRSAIGRRPAFEPGFVEPLDPAYSRCEEVAGPLAGPPVCVPHLHVRFRLAFQQGDGPGRLAFAAPPLVRSGPLGDELEAEVSAVLGIPTEVRASHGGIVVTLKAATGDPVEYGQEIFLLESIGEVAK